MTGQLPAHLRPWGGQHEQRGWEAADYSSGDMFSFRLDSPNGVTVLVIDRRHGHDPARVERAAREAAWVIDGNPWERGALRA